MDLAIVLSPIAILISAFGAWVYADKSIKSSAEVARKSATFDYISKLSWDKDYIEAKNTFLQICAGPKKLRAVAEEYEAAKSQGGQQQADKLHEIVSHHSAIKNILNEYEAMSIAIKTGVLDGEMLRENIQQQFVKHVDACTEFITFTRDNGNFKKPEKIWCELQVLATEWRAK